MSALSTSPAFEVKVQALAKLSEKPANDTLNRLFFDARNLAIEAMLRGLEVVLLRQGFPAECSWRETSFGGPTLDISMRNTGSGSWELGTCAVRVARHRVSAPDFLSDALYVAESFSATEYWRGKQPAKLLAFRDAVSVLWDSGELARRVLEVNYPFERPSHSSF